MHAPPKTAVLSNFLMNRSIPYPQPLHSLTRHTPDFRSILLSLSLKVHEIKNNSVPSYQMYIMAILRSINKSINAVKNLNLEEGQLQWAPVGQALTTFHNDMSNLAYWASSIDSRLSQICNALDPVDGWLDGANYENGNKEMLNILWHLGNKLDNLQRREPGFYCFLGPNAERGVWDAITILKQGLDSAPLTRPLPISA